jgi:hemoglobin
MLSFSRLSVATGLVLQLGLGAAQANAQAEEPTLYQRMGGYDVIATFVDDFMARFDADPELVPYLGGINATAEARIRQHFVDFICALTGGPCLYTGQDMPSAHEGLAIQARHFEAVIGHMRDAREAQGIGDREKIEFLSTLKGLESQIVWQATEG